MIVGSRPRCLVCGSYVREGVLCPAHGNGGLTRPGEKRTVEELDLGALEVPREYQRQLKERLVKQIVAEFDIGLIGLLTVCRSEDGRLLLMDGQHRWMALVELGQERWLCEVLHGLSLARQAEIFSGRNQRRIAVDRLDGFRADQVAGDPGAIAIVKVLARHGYGIASQRRRATADQLVCVETLREIHSWGCLEETMTLARGAWPQDASVTQAVLLQGVAAVLHQHPQVSRRELIHAWGRMPVAEILSAARIRAASSRHRRGWIHVAAVLVEVYNRGRRAANRLPESEVPFQAARDWKLRRDRAEGEDLRRAGRPARMP